MAFDFAAAKSHLRRVVHDTLGVVAFYSDDVVSDPLEVKARWHNKLELFGDPNNEGYAQVLQGIDRIILIPSDYPGVTFKRGGVFEFPSYNMTFKLDTREPNDGPLKQVWQAVVVP